MSGDGIQKWAGGSGDAGARLGRSVPGDAAGTPHPDSQTPIGDCRFGDCYVPHMCSYGLVGGIGGALVQVNFLRQGLPQ